MSIPKKPISCRHCGETWEITCLRCAHTWIPRIGYPNVCPECHSAVWDQEDESLSVQKRLAVQREVEG